MARGRYIVLEGPKGVGKTTQALLLESTLKSAHMPVKLISEDDDQNDTSLLAIESLVADTNHPLNNHTKLLLYNAARSRSLDIIRSEIDKGTICIADQNYLTTLTMQYYGLHSIDNYESLNQIINFANYNIEPDITIILDAEVPTLIERLKDSASEEMLKIYDESLLDRLRAGYLWEAKERGYQTVYAIGSKGDIFNAIWGIVTENLAPDDKSPNLTLLSPAHIDSIGEIISHRASGVQQEKPSIIHESKIIKSQSTKETDKISQPITEPLDPRAILERIITNTKDNIYGFTSILSPETVGHLITHATNKQMDIRSTILEDYCAADKESRRKLMAASNAKDNKKTLSDISRYIVIERISSLAASYIERAGMNITYQKLSLTELNKDSQKSQIAAFYTPNKLDKNSQNKYQQDVIQILGLSQKISENLIDYLSITLKISDELYKSKINHIQKIARRATKQLTPVSVYKSIVIYEPISSLRQLAENLANENLPELRQISKQLTQEITKLLFENESELPNSSSNPKLTNQLKLSNLVDKYYSKVKVDTDESLALIQYSPKNEVNLINETLYTQTNATSTSLNMATEQLTYDKKLEIFNLIIVQALMGRDSHSTLNKLHYEFETICDYEIICELKRKKLFRQLDIQELTPRYGFAMPDLIDQADEIDNFEQAFNLSLNLYSSMQTDHLPIAQYATLFGHKQRVKFILDGNDIINISRLRQQNESYPGISHFLNNIYEKVSDVHPTLIELLGKS